MKNTISTFRSALLVVALAFAPVTASLHAQMADRVQVNVPFDFQDGSMTLPAGVYTLSMRAHNILNIRGANEGAMAMVRTEDTGRNTPKIGKVVFQRYGEKYFLREVWSPGQSTHTVCAITNAEKKASQASQTQVAATSAAPTSISLALLKPIR